MDTFFPSLNVAQKLDFILCKRCWTNLGEMAFSPSLSSFSHVAAAAWWTHKPTYLLCWPVEDEYHLTFPEPTSLCMTSSLSPGGVILSPSGSPNSPLPLPSPHLSPLSTAYASTSLLSGHATEQSQFSLFCLCFCEARS